MIELSAAVRNLLDGANYAHVATVLPDGGPHSVPVWIGQPYPLRTDRVVFLIEPEHESVQAYG